MKSLKINTTKLGNFGEQIAVTYLEGKGFKILARQFRYKRAEVDIVALDGESVVFVEVKYRSSTNYGKPEEFVNKHKERLYFAAANEYIELHEHKGEIRFDIISIIKYPKTEPIITHYPDAFFF